MDITLPDTTHRLDRNFEYVSNCMSAIFKSEFLIKHPKIGVVDVFLALPLRFSTVSGSDHSSGFR